MAGPSACASCLSAVLHTRSRQVSGKDLLMSVAVSQPQPWATAASAAHLEGSCFGPQTTAGQAVPGVLELPEAAAISSQDVPSQAASFQPDSMQATQQADTAPLGTDELVEGAHKKQSAKGHPTRSEAGRRAVKRRIVARQAARRSSARLSADELNTQLEAARERERAMCEHAETVEARSRALSIELDIMQRRADRELAVQHEMEEQVRRLRASVMMQMQGQDDLAMQHVEAHDPVEASSSAGSAPDYQNAANLDMADNVPSHSEAES